MRFKIISRGDAVCVPHSYFGGFGFTQVDSRHIPDTMSTSTQL